MLTRRQPMLMMVLMLVAGVLISSQAMAFIYTSIDYPGTSVTETKALDINNLNQIVGSYVDSTGTHGFLYDGASTSPFVTLDYPSAQGTWALGVNDSDEIVGRYMDGSGIFHGFYYDGNGNYSSLDDPNGVSTEAFDINNSSEIVGRYIDSGNYSHGFISDGSSFVTEDYPGALASEADGINDAGTVVGFWDAVQLMHFPNGFTDDGTMTTFDYPSSDWTRLRGINNLGDMVGRYYINGGHQAFFYDGTSFIPLDFPGAAQTWAFGVNDADEITGFYQDQGGVIHAYIASPVPEPASLLLLGSGLIGMIGLRVKKRK